MPREVEEAIKMQSTAFERAVSEILEKCADFAYESIKIHEGWEVYEPLLADIFGADAAVKTNALLTIDQGLDDRWALTHENLQLLASYLYTMSFRLQASWSHAPHCLYIATKCIRLLSEIVSETSNQTGQGISKCFLPVAFTPASLSSLTDAEVSHKNSPQMSLCHLYFSLEALRLSPGFDLLARTVMEECRLTAQSGDDVKRSNAANFIAEKSIGFLGDRQTVISVKDFDLLKQDVFSVAAACSYFSSEGFNINTDVVDLLLATFKAKLQFHNTFLPTSLAWNPMQPFFPWFEESGVRQLEELLLMDGFRSNAHVAELHATTMASILRSERTSATKILMAYFPQHQLPIQFTRESMELEGNQKRILQAIAENPEFWTLDRYVNQALEYLGIPETDAWRDKLFGLSAN